MLSKIRYSDTPGLRHRGWSSSTHTRATLLLTSPLCLCPMLANSLWVAESSQGAAADWPWLGLAIGERAESREKPRSWCLLLSSIHIVDGERRKIPICILERTKRTLSLPSAIINRYFCRPRACNFSALAQSNHGMSPTGESADPRSTDCELTRAARLLLLHTYRDREAQMPK
jgi:hypothetical protein